MDIVTFGNFVLRKARTSLDYWNCREEQKKSADKPMFDKNTAIILINIYESNYKYIDKL